MNRSVDVPDRVVVVFVSEEVAAALRVWSDPVQVMLEPRVGEALVCDLIVRTVSS